MDVQRAFSYWQISTNQIDHADKIERIIKNLKTTSAALKINLGHIHTSEQHVVLMLRPHSTS